MQENECANIQAQCTKTKTGMSTGHGTSSAHRLLLSIDFKFVIINNNKGKI